MSNRYLKIELLKRAKGMLVNVPGICAALQYCANTPEEYIAVRQLKEYIGDALGTHSYLNGWVASETGYSYLHIRSCHKKMLVTRKAWIDWMIACYEEDIANGKT